jgi:hypothetical protein
MRVPYEGYIRFLITSGLDSEETNEHLEELGLSPIPAEYWDRQFEALHELKIPKKIKKFWRNPGRKIPNGFFEYMNVAGLKEAWEYNIGKNPHFKAAVEAAKDFDMSLIIRGLLAIKAPPEEITSVLNGKFGVVFRKISVQIFEKYFFNVKIMSRTSWKLYLKDLTNQERGIVYLGITGEDMELRAELGLPSKISVSESYQKLHVLAMKKFDRYAKAGMPDSDDEAMKWAKLAMSAGDKYEKLKVSDATDFVRDIQMEFDQVDTDFPMIGEDDLEEIKSNKDAGQNNDAAEPIPYQEGQEED